MANIKSTSFLEGDSLAFITVEKRNYIENKILGKDMFIQSGYTGSSFGTISINTGTTLFVGGNFRVLDL